MSDLDPAALAAIRADAASHQRRPQPYCTSCVEDIAQLCDEIERLSRLLDQERHGSAVNARVAIDLRTRLDDVAVHDGTCVNECEVCDAPIPAWKPVRDR